VFSVTEYLVLFGVKCFGLKSLNPVQISDSEGKGYAKITGCRRILFCIRSD